MKHHMSNDKNEAIKANMQKQKSTKLTGKLALQIPNKKVVA